jgi:hypothetical protein
MELLADTPVSRERISRSAASGRRGISARVSRSLERPFKVPSAVRVPVMMSSVSCCLRTLSGTSTK